MNGPTPIMFDMLSAVAWSRPKRRSSGADVVGVVIGARFYRTGPAGPVRSGGASR